MGFLQSTVNRVKRKYFSTLELSQWGCWESLTASEKQLAVRLVTVGGLEMAAKVVKVLKVVREVGLYNNTFQNTLRDVGLRACENIPQPCLSQECTREASFCYNSKKLNYRELEGGGI